MTYLTERREPIGRKEAAQLLELKVRRGGPEKLKTIQETVSALLGVEIDAFRAETGAATSLDMMRGTAAELDVDKFLVQGERRSGFVKRFDSFSIISLSSPTSC